MDDSKNVYYDGVANDRSAYQQLRARLEDRPIYQHRERLEDRQYYHLLEGNGEFRSEDSRNIIRYEQPRRVYQQEKQYYETSSVRRHF